MIELTSDELIERLEAWAVSVGNWKFHRDLVAYLEMVNRDDFEDILKRRKETAPE